MRIPNEIAVVTGASGGIGSAVAIALGRAGVAVALVGRRRETLAGVAAEIEGFGGRALVVRRDVTEGAAVEAAGRAVRETLGAPAILLNAAGFGVWKSFLDITAEEHRGMMDVMYWGAFHWVRAVLPGMRQRGFGHIVNIFRRIGAVRPSGDQRLQCRGLRSHRLFRSPAPRVPGSRIGVSCVNPGSVRTAFWDESRIPPVGLPPLVRYAPKISPRA